VIVLTLIIGAVNLCLGYALAVWLGYGPPDMLAAWDALNSPLPRRKPKVVHEAPPISPPSVAPPPVEEPAVEESVPAAMPETDPANLKLNEKYVETSVLKLNIAMMKSSARATRIDTRLREDAAQSNPMTIQACVADIREDCEAYLAEQSEAAASLHDRLGEMGELATLGEDIEMTNLEQAAQIETTLSNLHHMDFQSDLGAANVRLRDELHRLRNVRDKLRDNQEAAFLAIARQQNRMEEIEQQLYFDPLTGLFNRIGLEVTLRQWWKQGRHKSRPMSAALFDLDAFAQVNQQHGSALGDRVLFRMARFLEPAIGSNDLLCRFTGDSFLVVMLDVGPRAASKNAAQLRQLIENITFVSGEERIRLTVAGGVTEIQPEDTSDAPVNRLIEALREAKRAGSNSLFFHDGTAPVPLDLPHHEVEETEIAV
jgi:diguanylate cyclase (GGDEF)-like protein